MRHKFTALIPEVEKIKNLIKYDQLCIDIKELENTIEWSDIPKVQEYNKKINLRDTYDMIKRDLNDGLDLCEFEDEFPEMLSEDYKSLKRRIDTLLLECMFTGKYDANNAILVVHAGSGGVEAQDWARMLSRMYVRWAERRDFKWSVLDEQNGDVAGIKSMTLNVQGDNAFGLLKNEIGVHRLIRVSPFDSQSRRHTSFAAVEVIPEIELDNTIDIPAADLRIDTFRSSGAGGQHVNKTESAIRIVHIPSGITVECQTERSQHQNKANAMKMLVSKLMNIKEKEHLEEISQIKGEQKSIEWGSQIRTYTFMPYQLVKDHRTNCETGAIQSVMDGDIDAFIFENISKN